MPFYCEHATETWSTKNAIKVDITQSIDRQNKKRLVDRWSEKLTVDRLTTKIDYLLNLHC
jgi:hypothetical protein